MKRRCTVVLLFGLLLQGASIVESQSESIQLFVDPIVGTWKLNLARSTINAAILTRFPVAPNQVEVYRKLEDGRIQMVWTLSDANGPPVSSTTSWPERGGVTLDESGRASRGTITTVIGPGYLYVTHLEDGQQSHVVKKMVHGDGRTMTQTIVAAAIPGGRLFEHVLVWDRQ